jgi:hypothetical protein
MKNRPLVAGVSPKRSIKTHENLSIIFLIKESRKSALNVHKKRYSSIYRFSE